MSISEVMHFVVMLGEEFQFIIKVFTQVIKLCRFCVHFCHSNFVFMGLALCTENVRVGTCLGHLVLVKGKCNYL